jgi:TRAP-type mannitol/chloroaromatic compound transport system permease small subunit
MIPTGAFLLLLQGIAKLVRDIVTLLTGEKVTVPEAGGRETL